MYTFKYLFTVSIFEIIGSNYIYWINFFFETAKLEVRFDDD